MSESYRWWRLGHRISSGLVTLIALAHSVLTLRFYSQWTPDAVWFLGTGMGLLLLGIVNLYHIGPEACHHHTAPLVRTANWVFALFGVGALVAVPQPQAYVLVVVLFGQAIAGLRTLPGPVPDETFK